LIKLCLCLFLPTFRTASMYISFVFLQKWTALFFGTFAVDVHVQYTI